MCNTYRYINVRDPDVSWLNPHILVDKRSIHHPHSFHTYRLSHQPSASEQPRTWSNSHLVAVGVFFALKRLWQGWEKLQLELFFWCGFHLITVVSTINKMRLTLDMIWLSINGKWLQFHDVFFFLMWLDHISCNRLVTVKFMVISLVTRMMGWWLQGVSALCNLKPGDDQVDPAENVYLVDF